MMMMMMMMMMMYGDIDPARNQSPKAPMARAPTPQLLSIY